MLPSRLLLGRGSPAVHRAAAGAHPLGQPLGTSEELSTDLSVDRPHDSVPSVSTLAGRQIALYFTGRQHAGENIADVLRRRARESGPAIQMCDALSWNAPKLPGGVELLVAHCLAHGRRLVVEVAQNLAGAMMLRKGRRRPAIRVPRSRQGRHRNRPDAISVPAKDQLALP